MSRKKLLLSNNPLLSGPPLEERERGGNPYRELKISLIDRDSNQPRVHFDEEKLKELASSIKTYGVLNPIIVRPGKTQGRFTLVAGERRFRASMLAGLISIPAIVNHDLSDSSDNTLAVQLVENIQRADLSSLERAQAIGALKDSYNLSIRDIAEKLGVSKSMVQRSLEILELPDDLINALREGASESKILLLAQIEDEEVRSSYLKDLDILTRNKLKKDIDSGARGDKEAITTKLSTEDQRLIEEMQGALGMKVRMSRMPGKENQGRISVEFYSDEDLQELFRRLVQATE